MTDLATLKQQLADAEQEFAAAEAGLPKVRASQKIARLRLQIRALETGQDVKTLW